jgi:calcineurin-like phosphoesterase family protein
MDTSLKIEAIMGVFFTSDQHFGHENIIKYCHRPFGSVDDMDDEMVECWNLVVKPTDTVYHLGDFTLLGKDAAASYFRRLNGTINVLRNGWHHDKRWLPAYPDITTSVCHSRQGIPVTIADPLIVLEFPEYGDGKYPKPIVLCHYPIAEWDRKHYGAWHLHGHSHGNHQGEGLIWDIGVDNTRFYPVSLERVAREMDTLAKGL